MEKWCLIDIYQLQIIILMLEYVVNTITKSTESKILQGSEALIP
jgi:hypothetical protein